MLTLNSSWCKKTLDIDVLLIDHDKKLYKSDLVLFESAGLLGEDTLVIADNVLSFGVPIQDYLDYVRNESGPFKSSTCHISTIEYADASTSVPTEDGLEVSVHR